MTRVVADTRPFAWDVHDVLYEPAPPEIFLPLQQNPESGRDLAVLVRTQGEEGLLTSAIRRQIQILKPGQPVFHVETLKSIAEEALGPAPVAVDELIRQTRASAAAVLTVLLELELAGRCRRLPGNFVSWS